MWPPEPVGLGPARNPLEAGQPYEGRNFVIPGAGINTVHASPGRTPRCEWRAPPRIINVLLLPSDSTHNG